MELVSKDMVQQRDLPHDVITHHILTRLPIKPLVRFKSVSKQWYSTLCCPYYAQTHFKFPRSSTTESLLIQTDKKFQFLSYENGNVDLVKMEVDFDVGDEKLILVGSVNGLVCLGSTSGRLFVIWNPVTRKFRKYSDSKIGDFSTKGSMALWGFGRGSLIDDYKVVRICKNELVSSFDVHVCSVYVYPSSEGDILRDKWRSVCEDCEDCFFYPDFPFMRIGEVLRRPGVLVDERLYWMASYKFKEAPYPIFAFDLALECFDIYPDFCVTTPSVLEGDGEHFDEYFDEFLCVVEGRLSTYGGFPIFGNEEVIGDGVITIKNHPDHPGVFGKQTLVKRDLVGHMPCINLIEFTGSDKIFTQNYDTYAPRLGIIDLSSEPVKYTPLKTFEETTIVGIIGYSASLISPGFKPMTPMRAMTEDLNI